MPQGYSIKWFGKKVFELASTAGVAAVTTAALMLEADIKKSMTNTPRMPFSRKGRGVGRFHRPSAPGFPPAVDFGTLRASINHQITTDMTGINGFVGVEAGVKYGLFLELGTRNMAARPFLRPALVRNHDRIEAIVRRAFN